MKGRFDLPDLGIGLGLRTVHYTHILQERPAVDWFEVLSDNYMHTAGRPLHFWTRSPRATPSRFTG